jgi:hypothetical protein
VRRDHRQRPLRSRAHRRQPGPPLPERRHRAADPARRLADPRGGPRLRARGARALLGDPRGRQQLATASDLLRRHCRSEQVDAGETVIAHTLLAILYGLLPGLPGQDQYALYHLEQASELAEARAGCEAPTDGDVLVRAALTALAYAQLTAYAQLNAREAR